MKIIRAHIKDLRLNIEDYKLTYQQIIDGLIKIEEMTEKKIELYKTDETEIIKLTDIILDILERSLKSNRNNIKKYIEKVKK